MRPQLPHPVAGWEQRQHRLVQSGGDRLYLPAFDQPPHRIDDARVVLLQPLEEAAGVVHGDADVRELAEQLEEGCVALGDGAAEDGIEVAGRLMRVDDEAEGRGHLGRAGCVTGRRTRIPSGGNVSSSDCG